MKELGIPLFSGNITHDNTIVLTEDNYISVLEANNLTSNLNANSNYFQTKDIMDILYNHLRSENIKYNIITANPFKERFNNNNDLFIHIRLTDMTTYNPGINYYLHAISLIQFDKLYIATDDVHHPIIATISNKYPETLIVNMDPVKTIQFGSTCKNLILSYGSFSAIIAYIAFNSNNIYYPDIIYRNEGGCDMFSIPGWTMINKESYLTL